MLSWFYGLALGAERFEHFTRYRRDRLLGELLGMSGPTAMEHGGLMIGNSSGGIIRPQLPDAVVDIGDRACIRRRDATVVPTSSTANAARVAIGAAIRRANAAPFRTCLRGVNMYGDGRAAQTRGSGAAPVGLGIDAPAQAVRRARSDFRRRADGAPMRVTTFRGDRCRALMLGCAEPLRAAMNVMNESGRTLVLVTTGERLEGVIADGDIRRYLAAGGSIDMPVTAALNRTPITLPDDTPSDEVRSTMMRRGINYLPLVDGHDVSALCVLDSTPLASDLSAVIIAGGTGSRLAPLTESCPKPLLRLGDRPILAHVMDHLHDQGVGRFVLALNYLSHMIVDYFDDGSRLNSFIEYIDGLRLPDLAVSFCLNGDVVSDIDVRALLDTHVAKGWDATMVVHGHAVTVPYGVVESGDDGQFLQIVEKPVLPFQINAGIYMFSKSALAAVPSDEYYDMPTLFDDVGAHGLSRGIFVHQAGGSTSGRWTTIGEPSRSLTVTAGPNDRERHHTLTAGSARHRTHHQPVRPGCARGARAAFEADPRPAGSCSHRRARPSRGNARPGLSALGTSGKSGSGSSDCSQRKLTLCSLSQSG